MDYFLGENTVAEDLHPIYTIWNHYTVKKDIIAHKRRARRTYRHYLKTGNIRDFDRSQRKISRYDFD